MLPSPYYEYYYDEGIKEFVKIGESTKSFAADSKMTIKKFLYEDKCIVTKRFLSVDDDPVEVYLALGLFIKKWRPTLIEFKCGVN